MFPPSWGFSLTLMPCKKQTCLFWIHQSWVKLDPGLMVILSQGFCYLLPFLIAHYPFSLATNPFAADFLQGGETWIFFSAPLKCLLSMPALP